MPCKLCGWHTRRRHVYVQHVNSRLEEMWPQEFVWASGIYKNGDFNLKSREVSQMIRTIHPCVSRLHHLWLSLSLLTICTSWVIKRKEIDYIFIPQCCCLFWLYKNNNFLQKMICCVPFLTFLSLGRSCYYKSRQLFPWNGFGYSLH